MTTRFSKATIFLTLTKNLIYRLSLIVCLICSFDRLSAQAPRAFPSGLPSCLEHDFRELEKLYDATNGDNWTNKTNWFTSNNMASWYGVFISGDGCGVVKLTLQSNNLVGTIPALSLSYLKYFYLFNNQLSGSIPTLNTPVLIDITANNNQLSGSIPNFSMSSLQYIILSNNQLSGSIPAFSLPNLLALDLYNNNLDGTIPNFTTPSLTKLYLDDNLLTGSIPNFNYPNLTELRLSINQLSGSIPTFTLPSLTKLQLYSNQLTGNIPNFNMPNLTEMVLSNNQLQGAIPNFSMPSLNKVHLHANKFIFGDMIGKSWLSAADLRYVNQAQIPLSFNGSVLSVATGEPDNVQTFQWYRNGLLVATTQSSQYTPTINGTYSCQITHSTLTIPSDIYKNLILQSQDYSVITLSVELLSFTATPLNKTIELNWQTASEQNSSYFEIERSSDGKTFRTIGQIKSKNGSTNSQNYVLTDETPLAGINYYRLRQIDLDRKETLFHTISAQFQKNAKIHIFPSTATDRLTILGKTTQSYTVFDLLGRVILRGVLIENQTDIDVSLLHSGFYFLETENGLARFFKQ